MRSCQRWGIYLFLATNWSGLCLCIFSHLFKSQKLQNTGFDLDHCHVPSSLLITISLFFSATHYALRHRKSLWQRGHPCPTRCIYVSCLFLLHFSSSPTTQLLPGLLLSCLSLPPTLLSLYCPVGFFILSAISKWLFRQWRQSRTELNYLFSEV